MEVALKAGKEKMSGTSYVVSAFFAFIFLSVLVTFFPSALPFGLFEFWRIKGSLWEAVVISWPVFIFGMAVNVYSLFTVRNHYSLKPAQILIGGFGISVWAGVMEEICFRWIIFLSATITIPILDWLLLGFMSLHPVQWLYTCALCPVANFFTLGLLRPLLLNSARWAVGAALISANGDFRDGHSYQGWGGFIISWFAGMYFFWLMFNYGLVAAILVHFLYDLFIFMVVAIDAQMEKWLYGK